MVNRMKVKAYNIKKQIFAFFTVTLVLIAVQSYAQDTQNNRAAPQMVQSSSKNSSSKSSFSPASFENLVLKMYVSRFYNVPSYWFEQGIWQKENEYTQIAGGDDEIISPYQLNMIKKVRYYRYTGRHPLDAGYAACTKEFLSRFSFYRFKGKTMIPWVDVYLFALDMHTGLLFSYALPSRFDKVWGNYVPRDWIPIEQHPYIREHFPDTAFYQFDPVGYVTHEGKIVMYEWIMKQNGRKEKDPLVNYLPRFQYNQQEASPAGAGYSPYKK